MKTEDVTPAQFKEAFADLIASWNVLEGAARFLVEAMAGLLGREGRALSAHIPNKTLTNTIRALSEQYDNDCIEHAKRFSDGFDVLCSWRNYYVHGFRGVTNSHGGAHGFIHEIETKTGRLASVERLISHAELTEMSSVTAGYASYGSVIAGHVYDKRGVTLFAYGPLATTIKPDLPPRLERKRHYLLDSNGLSASA